MSTQADEKRQNEPVEAARGVSTRQLLKRLGIDSQNAGVFCGEWIGSGAEIQSVSPIDGQALAGIITANRDEYELALARSRAAFEKWREGPAPKRGDFVRQFGNALGEAKRDLGQLVTLETGKNLAEGDGHEQEMLDIGD